MNINNFNKFYMYNILYRDKTGRTTNRDIVVYNLVTIRENSYLQTYCYLRNDTRNFLVERILEITRLGLITKHNYLKIKDNYIKQLIEIEYPLLKVPETICTLSKIDIETYNTNMLNTINITSTQTQILNIKEKKMIKYTLKYGYKSAYVQIVNQIFNNAYNIDSETFIKNIDIVIKNLPQFDRDILDNYCAKKKFKLIQDYKIIANQNFDIKLAYLYNLKCQKRGLVKLLEYKKLINAIINLQLLQYKSKNHIWIKDKIKNLPNKNILLYKNNNLNIKYFINNKSLVLTEKGKIYTVNLRQNNNDDDVILIKE